MSVKHHDSTSLRHARALLDSLGALTSSSIHSGPRSSSCGQEGEYSKKSSDLVVPNSRRILKLCQKYYAGFQRAIKGLCARERAPLLLTIRLFGF